MQRMVCNVYVLLAVFDACVLTQICAVGIMSYIDAVLCCLCVLCVCCCVLLATCLLLYVISIMFNTYEGLNTVVTRV